MRVLLLGKFYPVMGGVEKVMYDLMSGVSARGIECDMLCAAAHKGHGGEERLSRNARLMVCRTWMKKAGVTIAPNMICKLRRIMGGYDIIHVHHPDPMAALALWLSGYKGKVLLHWHSDIVRQKRLMKLYEPLQSWLIRRADYIIGTTPVYVKESPYLRNVQDKLGYLPIGVPQFHPVSEKVMKLRSGYPGKKLLLAVGRCVYYKGFEYLIEAMMYLPEDYHLLLAGRGELKEELERQIVELGLEEKVTMLGYVEDEMMPMLYGACDAYVLSSVEKTEAFAIVQIEAMSCGKPVVATQIAGSGVPWVNAHGISGLNVPVRDAKAIARAVCEVLDPKNYQGFCDRALDRYYTLFTEKDMAEGCIEIYDSLMKS